MQRIVRFGRLKTDAVDMYHNLHRDMSEELIEVHRSAGFRNFSIYLRGVDLFSYLECDDWDLALKKFAANPTAQEWSVRIRDLLDEPLDWEILEEVWRLD